MKEQEVNSSRESRCEVGKADWERARERLGREEEEMCATNERDKRRQQSLWGRQCDSWMWSALLTRSRLPGNR